MWSFSTIYKTTIWGGTQIAELKGEKLSQANIGESWEISSVPGSVSVVDSAEDRGLSLGDLIGKYGADLLGKNNFERFGTRFPLLVKFIDASRDLSIQVHPDSEMATDEGLENGKTEMWYVIRTDRDSKIANGFIRPVDRTTYEHLVHSGEIEKWLRHTPTSPGMSFLIPPGRIHAIGKGNLICEIQESSDATYRIYDYKRRDADGNLRELHTEKALRALNFVDCDGGCIKPEIISKGDHKLVSRPEFTVNLLTGERAVSRNYSGLDSFVLLVVIDGEAEVKVNPEECPGAKEMRLRKGDVVLVPAQARGITVDPTQKITLLESYIED